MLGCVFTFLAFMFCVVAYLAYDAFVKRDWNGMVPSGFLFGIGFVMYLIRPDWMRRVKGQDRIELLPDRIAQYDFEGNLVASGLIRDVERLRTCSLGQVGSEVFVVKFRDGQELSFDGRLDNDWKLQKTLKLRTGMNFEGHDTTIEGSRDGDI